MKETRKVQYEVTKLVEVNLVRGVNGKAAVEARCFVTDARCSGPSTFDVHLQQDDSTKDTKESLIAALESVLRDLRSSEKAVIQIPISYHSQVPA